ncbi:hypothetical protein K2X33_12300 [bacterium]|nr:hypothetical protein [bacterium]
MTFNGDPTHKGFSKVETLRLNKERRRLIAAELVFPAESHQPAMRNSGRRPYATVDNPSSCVGCHSIDRFSGRIPSDDLVAFVDIYGYWPGWFGSVHDFAPSGSLEARAIESFGNRFQQLPRYRHLVTAHPLRTDLLVHQRNANATVGLYRQNYELMARRIEEAPGFEEHKHAILAALSGTENLEVYYPSSRQTYSHFLELTTREFEDHYETLYTLGKTHDPGANIPKGREISLIDPPPPLFADHRVARLRYVLEGQMGVSMQGWGLNFDPNRVFKDGDKEFGGLLKALTPTEARMECLSHLLH